MLTKRRERSIVDAIFLDSAQFRRRRLGVFGICVLSAQEVHTEDRNLLVQVAVRRGLRNTRARGAVKAGIGSIVLTLTRWSVRETWM